MRHNVGLDGLDGRDGGYGDGPQNNTIKNGQEVKILTVPESFHPTRS